MSSTYDPIGFTVPFVLKAKILQECCNQKINWDDTIPVEQQRQWYSWCQELARLQQLKIERCYKPEGFGRVSNTELNHFADASKDGYGCITNLRLTNENDEILQIHNVLLL